MTFDVWGRTFLPSHINFVLMGLALLTAVALFALGRFLPPPSPLTYLLGPVEWLVGIVSIVFILYELGVLDADDPVQRTIALFLGGGLSLSAAVIGIYRLVLFRAAAAGYLAALARSRVVRIAMLLVAVQFASWWWFGRHRVYEAVPSMAEAVMDLYQMRAKRLGTDVNGKRDPLNLVVCKQLSAELGSEGITKLRARLQPYGVTIFTEESAPRPFLANRWKCDGCQVFCYEAKSNSPLVGVVETMTWWGGLGANGFTNVSIFLFGRWFRIATWQAWVA